MILQPGDPIPIPMIYHDYTAETYIITSGSGVLTTGGPIVNKHSLLIAEEEGAYAYQKGRGHGSIH